jgi:hypothetical protein
MFIRYCATGSEFVCVVLRLADISLANMNARNISVVLLWYHNRTAVKTARYKPRHINAGFMIIFLNFWSEPFMNLKQELQRVPHDGSSDILFSQTQQGDVESCII